MIPDLSTRSTALEIMDDFSLSDTEIVPVLKGLEKLNSLLGGHKTLINALKQIPVTAHDHISDWGCGGGDALRAINDRLGKEEGMNLKLTGVDATPSAVEFARQKASSYPNIDFILTDVMSDTLKPNQFDIVFSSLFTHHFTDEQWIALVKKMMRCSKKAVIITDLHRHWVLYWAVVFIAHTFTASKMARVDGPLSVKRSFKKRELVNLLQQSGLTNYKISWKWAFRWQVIIYKS